MYKIAGKNSNATSPGGTLPLLGWITNALKNSIYYKSIFVATSTETENDELMKFARQYEVHIFRGSEDDVFSRFNLIARNNDFDTIIRLTGDNPILDIKVLDNAIDYHLSSGAQYTITKGLPIGMNFEIIDVNSFINIDPDSLTIEEKEHVTLHMRSSGNFNIREYIPYPNIDYNKIRLTIDYPTDFIVVSCLISIGEYLNMKPGLGLIDYCIKNYPWLFEVNQQNHQKTNYKNLQEEWVRAEPILEKFEFKRIISLLKEKV
ncbi:hypothetical protein FK178_01765 [Antarcticibacterium arcticum]|uniref:Acylneuraminate cytidylyltransferase n=1 Tax=Antarcticibacterium arcticum TaxID=2585771 RepID=A0A5B8YI60_9FLAO|nr:hypothetical protein FK178_01765 [Antarcticibacterium arcticum]